MIEEMTRGKAVNPNTIFLLNKKEIAYQAACQYVLPFQTPIANIIFFEDFAQMKTAFTTSFTAQNIQVNDFHERSNNNDNRILFQIKDKMSQQFPKMTTELWQTVQDENQAVFNENKTQSKTNKLIADAFLEESNISISKIKASIKNIVNKEFKTHEK